MPGRGNDNADQGGHCWVLRGATGPGCAGYHLRIRACLLCLGALFDTVLLHFLVFCYAKVCVYIGENCAVDEHMS